MTEKERFAVLARTGRFKITELCKDFGISRKTGKPNYVRSCRLHLNYRTFLALPRMGLCNSSKEGLEKVTEGVHPWKCQDPACRCPSWDRSLFRQSGPS